MRCCFVSSARFARNVKPGLRPVAALNDPTVLVAPADSTFVDWWQVGDTSEIFVTSNGLRWSTPAFGRQPLYGLETKRAPLLHVVARSLKVSRKPL